jgi:RNA polymerase sigma factor (sigma-70 family)
MSTCCATPFRPTTPRARGASPAAPGDVTASLDVAELLQQAADGDPAAWDEIIGRYRGLVSAKIRTFRLQDADALDAMQLTWLQLAENIHRIQHPERLGGWLATTAARACLHILRQATRTQPVIDALVDTLADSSASPEQQVIDTHAAQILHTLIAELPPRRRSLLRALFSDDPPLYTEISRTTGIPLGSIGPTRNRALHQLRQMLQDHQLAPPA